MKVKKHLRVLPSAAVCLVTSSVSYVREDLFVVLFSFLICLPV